MVMGRWEGREGNGMVKQRLWVRGKWFPKEKESLREGEGVRGVRDSGRRKG